MVRQVSSASGLIREIKDLASSSFSSVSFAFAPRSCNEVAHKLATKGLQNVRHFYWQYSKLYE
jgi:hypothetical protein